MRRVDRVVSSKSLRADSRVIARRLLIVACVEAAPCVAPFEALVARAREHAERGVAALQRSQRNLQRYVEAESGEPQLGVSSPPRRGRDTLRGREKPPPRRARLTTTNRRRETASDTPVGTRAGHRRTRSNSPCRAGAFGSTAASRASSGRSIPSPDRRGTCAVDAHALVAPTRGRRTAARRVRASGVAKGRRWGSATLCCRRSVCWRGSRLHPERNTCSTFERG